MIRGIDLKVVQFCIPVGFQRIDLLSDLSGWICIGVCYGCGFCRGFHAEKEEHGPGFAGIQSDFVGEGAAGILIVACDIAKITRDHALRIAISVVFPEKCILVSAVGGDFSARKSEETLGHFLVIHFFVLPERVKIAVDLLDDPVLFK